VTSEAVEIEPSESIADVLNDAGKTHPFLVQMTDGATGNDLALHTSFAVPLIERL
jgi:hypothetical protein